MQTATKETRADSAKSQPASATNVGTIRRERRWRQGGGRTFGMNVGECIVLALAVGAGRPR